MLNFKKQPYQEYKEELLKGLKPKGRTNLLEANGFLGDDYLIRYIDAEPCIYRDLKNGYDIEVSGVYNPRAKNRTFTIFVWDTSKMVTVRTIRPLNTLRELKENLDCVVNEFGELSN